eukprot:NODE_3151_length_809_cov_58.944737_g2626_i0.p1 GENE.NODE_3151_length_809_cov_58.944737_g2626_i0~~NODE_3151_length_809_cov_58.944737_g2626_i0.p1  ORF type:complete len:206 (+),score=46.43 NODE_3151_length_809_cov_58.944737_g2626_i0:34-651(+)
MGTSDVMENIEQMLWRGDSLDDIIEDMSITFRSQRQSSDAARLAGQLGKVARVARLSPSRLNNSRACAQNIDETLVVNVMPKHISVGVSPLAVWFDEAFPVIRVVSGLRDVAAPSPNKTRRRVTVVDNHRRGSDPGPAFEMPSGTTHAPRRHSTGSWSRRQTPDRERSPQNNNSRDLSPPTRTQRIRHKLNKMFRRDSLPPPPPS